MNTHSHNDNNLQPEDSGVKARPILMFLIILTVSTVVVFVIIKGLLWSFAKMETMNPEMPATMVSAPKNRKVPPAPRLQGAPGEDSTDKVNVASDLPLEDLKKNLNDTKAYSESYGWVKKEAGVVHIPIERAKSLIAEKGLPVRPETSIAEIEKAAETRKAVLNAGSNAGRLIKTQ